jgi:hypothetical protein
MTQSVKEETSEGAAHRGRGGLAASLARICGKAAAPGARAASLRSSGKRRGSGVLGHGRGENRANRGRGSGVGLRVGVGKKGRGAYVVWGDQQRHLVGGRGRRRCCVNRELRRGMADAVRERLTGGSGRQRGQEVSGGVRE